MPPIIGFHQWLRRVCGCGRIAREGVITRFERFDFKQPAGVPGAFAMAGTASPKCVWVFLDGDTEPAGWMHHTMTIHRAKNGERVRLKVHPEDGYIGSIKPLERVIRWWQY